MRIWVTGDDRLETKRAVVEALKKAGHRAYCDEIKDDLQDARCDGKVELHQGFALFRVGGGDYGDGSSGGYDLDRKLERILFMAEGR